ncbi:MAG: hypothetical protein N3E51_04555 [Candidatus Micrarchaeota archaeon]|nr:hypothetical protein [Candidatus Micrarchaeota archaeon]
MSASSEESVNRILITVSAVILLACAVVLLLFVFFSRHFSLVSATAISIVAISAGAIFCWKSLAIAQTILLLSLLISQFVLLRFAGWLLVPFIVIDILTIVAMTQVISHKED